MFYFPAAQPEGVSNNDEVAHAHGEGGEDGAEKAEGRERNAECVVKEGPEQVLLDRPERGARKTERFATVRVGPAEKSNAMIPDRLRTIAPLAPREAVANRVVTMSERLSIRRGTDFLINGITRCDRQPDELRRD